MGAASSGCWWVMGLFFTVRSFGGVGFVWRGVGQGSGVLFWFVVVVFCLCLLGEVLRLHIHTHKYV